MDEEAVNLTWCTYKPLLCVRRPFSEARSQPLPSLRSVQGLRLMLFLQQSAPALQVKEYTMDKAFIKRTRFQIVEQENINSIKNID